MDFSKVPKLEIDDAGAFIRNLPQAVKKEWLKDIETKFHFDIVGDTGGQFTVEVKDEKMEVTEGLLGDANCTIAAKEKNFIKLLKGDLNPMMAVFTGKLKVSNPGEIMKYAKLFGLG